MYQSLLYLPLFSKGLWSSSTPVRLDRSPLVTNIRLFPVPRSKPDCWNLGRLSINIFSLARSLLYQFYNNGKDLYTRSWLKKSFNYIFQQTIHRLTINLHVCFAETTLLLVLDHLFQVNLAAWIYQFFLRCCLLQQGILCTYCVIVFLRFINHLDRHLR